MPRLTLALCSVTFTLASAHAAEPNVILSSSAILPGETLRVELDNIEPALRSKALFRGKSYPFFVVGPNAQRALIGIPLAAVPGSYPLVVHHSRSGSAPSLGDEKVTVTVATRTFVTENINLPPEKTTLMKTEHQESARIHHLAMILSPEQYWEGVFQPPVAGPVVGLFGLKRTRNGTIDAGFHKGIDIQAKGGTDLRASNAGVIVLAARLKAHGRTVLINHGQGVMSIYLHMQSLAVKPGQKVAKGGLIGKVGSSGISTAPHVHWEIFVHSVPVDPTPWTETEF
jgi:murein DD-endopeptidase MepM/ murein hydrolase activator NlpD